MGSMGTSDNDTLVLSLFEQLLKGSSSPLEQGWSVLRLVMVVYIMDDLFSRLGEGVEVFGGSRQKCLRL